MINLDMMRLPQHGEFSEEEYEALYLLANPCLNCSNATVNTTVSRSPT